MVRSTGPILFLLLLGIAHAGLKFGEKGIVVSSGTESYTLPFPELNTSDGVQKASLKKKGTRKIQLGYADCTLTMDIRRSTVQLQFAGNTDKVKSFVFKSMLIPFSNAGKGTWSIGGQDGKFPADKPDKPFLFQGNERTFVLHSSSGAKLSFELPPYTYQQLQDNREWKWKIFAWWFSVPFNKDKLTYEFTISADK